MSRHAEKQCTDDSLKIDIRQWQREGLLVTGTAFDSTWQRGGETIASMNVSVNADCVKLRYQVEINGKSKLMVYPIKLNKQPVYFGGQRHWLVCPICNRQLALLYCHNGVFACRQCHNLGYRVQREQTYQRAIRKAEKLRSKLKWQGGILSGLGDKPKCMHRRTFERLQDETYYYTVQGMSGMVAMLDKLNATLE